MHHGFEQLAPLHVQWNDLPHGFHLLALALVVLVHGAEDATSLCLPTMVPDVVTLWGTSVFLHVEARGENALQQPKAASQRFFIWL